MITEPHEYVDDCDCQACAVKSRDLYKKAWQKAEMQVVACGVAAHHPDPLLTTTGAYAREWNSQQLEDVRALRLELDQLKSCEADTVRLNWLGNNFYFREMSNDDRRAYSSLKNMWVFFAPDGVGSDIRRVLDKCIEQDSAQPLGGSDNG